jgi:[ribosomal protein S5]-alanine N-acetyltransferase
MYLKDNEITLRKLTYADRFDLAEQANNINVSQNLRDAFPNPYTLNDAEFFIKNIANNEKNHIFGIFYEGNYCGNTGLHPGEDVYRLSAELGYFIGEKFWNKGITSRAVKLITDFGFYELNIVKIYAGIFEFNHPSMRVLEKCGFKLEGILKKSIIKNGKICDEYRYGMVNPRLKE